MTITALAEASRHAGARAAPGDQPWPRVPELQRLSAYPSTAGGKRASPRSGCPPHTRAHDRAGGRLRIDRAVQPGVQGALRNDADRVPAGIRRRRRACCRDRARKRTPRRGRSLADFGFGDSSSGIGEPCGSPPARLAASSRPNAGMRIRIVNLEIHMTHLVQSGRCALLVCAALLAPPCAVAATAVVGDLPRAADRPLESLPGVDTEYGELRIGGDTRLRTIVTRPAGVQGRLPAVLYVQWLSCDSIEIKPDAADGWTTMLRRLITESGVLWQRVDKSGVGDSQGPAVLRARLRDRARPASRGAAAAAQPTRRGSEARRDLRCQHGLQHGPTPRRRAGRGRCRRVGRRRHDVVRAHAAFRAQCARARRHGPRAARVRSQRACGVPRAIPDSGRVARSHRSERSGARQGLVTDGRHER